MTNLTNQLADLSEHVNEIDTALGFVNERLNALESRQGPPTQLELRDAFASAALQAILPFKSDNNELAVKEAYEIADKMLEESNNEPTPTERPVDPGTE